MATHSTVLAWRIPGTVEPGGLPSLGSHRVRHDWSDLAAVAAYCYLLLLLFRCSVMSDSLWPHGLQHARLPCPSPSPGVCSNSYPLSRWCHPTISSSAVLFSSCPQSCPASGSFLTALHIRWPKYWRFSFNINPSMTIQDRFPLGWTGLSFLLSEGLSRVLFSTIIWKHPFVGAQPPLWSNSHICTWLLEKP